MRLGVSGRTERLSGTTSEKLAYSVACCACAGITAWYCQPYPYRSLRYSGRVWYQMECSTKVAYAGTKRYAVLRLHQLVPRVCGTEVGYVATHGIRTEVGYGTNGVQYDGMLWMGPTVSGTTV